MANLFDSLDIRGITLKNRVVISPMCQYKSVDGFANDWHLVHYGSRAVGGSSLILSEACAVNSNGRITNDCLGIWSDDHISGLSKITQFVHEYGAICGIQLAHSGRKGSSVSPFKGIGRSQKLYLTKDQGGFDVYGPTKQKFEDSSIEPIQLSINQIYGLIEDYARATKRAVKAGFKFIEIHAAHGYLLHSFYSNLTNTRNDEFGGSFANRIKLLLLVFKTVRENFPEEYPISVRLSVSDHYDNGITIEDSIKIAQELKSLGADFIDCSSGHLVKNQKMPSNDLKFQSEYAKQIKAKTNIKTMAVGNIDNFKYANYIIEQDIADLALIARASIKDPYFAYHASQALNFVESQTLPKNYSYAI